MKTWFLCMTCFRIIQLSLSWSTLIVLFRRLIEMFGLTYLFNLLTEGRGEVIMLRVTMGPFLGKTLMPCWRRILPSMPLLFKG